MTRCELCHVLVHLPMCHKKNTPRHLSAQHPFQLRKGSNLQPSNDAKPSPGRDRLLPSKPGDPSVEQELQQVDPSVIVSSTLAVERTVASSPFGFLLVFCEGNLLVFSFKVKKSDF